MTVERYLISQFHGKPVVGDQVQLGLVKIIVRETEGERIVSVGLKLST
jgi:cell volume regulation protein A